MASSVTARVEKATSDLLIGPDWTMNMDICDLINCNSWQAKDVLKALKKRFQHKSSNVQMLALTLLETMAKNCGDPVHFQISERKILQEMVKIVKKRTNMQVRDKILLLLDSWQEAFGGPSGKHPHYYWAYDDIRRSGMEFPPREPDAAPVLTPPATIPSPIRVQSERVHPGVSSSSQSLHEAMASEAEPVSFSRMSSIEDAMNLLSEMLQESKPTNCRVAEDDVVVDLVDQCRANKKKLIQMLAITVDEVMLGRGLELNDRLQNVLGRYDELLSIPKPAPSSAIATSSTATSSNATSSNAVSSPSLSSIANVRPPETPSRPKPSSSSDDGDGDDDFAQLARRHTRVTPVRNDRRPVPTPTGGDGTLVPVNVSQPTPAKKTEDIIDLLTMSLSVAPQPPDPEPVGGDDDYVASWARSAPSGTAQLPQALQVHAVDPPSQKNPTYRSYGSFSTPVAPFVAPSVPTKQFIPSYKLFDDLDVFGNSNRDTSSSSSSSGSSSTSTSVVPERK